MTKHYGMVYLINIIVSVFDGNYDALDDIIRNKEINVLVRYACLQAYGCFYESGTLDKEVIIKYMLDLVEYYGYKKDEIYSWIADLIADIKLFELMDLVRLLFEKKLIDPRLLGEYDGFVDCIFDYEHRFKPYVIEDTTKEMSWWYCFTENEDGRSDIDIDEAFDKLYGDNLEITSTKIGRNEPCPCGSGKKYKHCCIN